MLATSHDGSDNGLIKEPTERSFSEAASQFSYCSTTAVLISHTQGVQNGIYDI